MQTSNRILTARLMSNPLTALSLFCLALLTILFISACGGPGGSVDGQTGQGVCTLTLEQLSLVDPLPPECLTLLPDPESTLSPRVFILGSETDQDGKLHIYVHGVDAEGIPMPLIDFQTATTVTVDGSVRLNNGIDENGGGVTVQDIADGSPLSLAFLTDYSFSISEANLAQIGQVYDQVLTALPAGFEAKVLNFSNSTVVRQDWTADLPTLRNAVQFDPNFAPRDNTALYGGIRDTLDRPLDPAGSGLADRCRPVRILVMHTDGIDNFSTPDPNTSAILKAELLTRIDDSRTVAVMLGTLTADKAELEDFAGSRGAFVYAYDVNGIQTAVSGWSGSFANIVEFVIDAGLFGNPGAVQIGIGTLSVTVEAPYDLPCILPAP